MLIPLLLASTLELPLALSAQIDAADLLAITCEWLQDAVLLGWF